MSSCLMALGSMKGISSRRPVRFACTGKGYARFGTALGWPPPDVMTVIPIAPRLRAEVKFFGRHRQSNARWHAALDQKMRCYEICSWPAVAALAPLKKVLAWLGAVFLPGFSFFLACRTFEISCVLIE
jgi:hypothetical protein